MISEDYEWNLSIALRRIMLAPWSHSFPLWETCLIQHTSKHSIICLSLRSLAHITVILGLSDTGGTIILTTGRQCITGKHGRRRNFSLHSFLPVYHISSKRCDFLCSNSSLFFHTVSNLQSLTTPWEGSVHRCTDFRVGWSWDYTDGWMWRLR